MKKKITRCPHCGSTEGIFTKTVYRNVIHNIGFDGEEQENYEMYDEATIEQGKNRLLPRVRGAHLPHEHPPGTVGGAR